MKEINDVLKHFKFNSENYEHYFSQFSNVPHYCIPSLNNHFKRGAQYKDKITFIENYEKPSYNISSTLPFGEPVLMQSDNLNGLDPLTDLVIDKKQWEAVKYKIIRAQLRSRSCNIKSKNKKVKFISPGIINLSKHLQNDPDSNFIGGNLYYNWYYTHGSLNVISLYDKSYLLSTRISLPGAVVVTPINVNKKGCTALEDTICLHTDSNETIFNTAVNNNYVALRQKHSTTLFSLDCRKRVKSKVISEIYEDNDSILSVSISNALNGEFCTLTSSQTVKLWSPKKKDCILSFKIENDKYNIINDDNWGSVKYLSDNYLLVCNRNIIYLKDKRTNLNSDLKWWTRKSYNSCGNISSLDLSKCYPNVAYIGTSHHLYELDIRRGFSKRWAHMLEFPPMYQVSDSLIDGSEMLIVGSQNVNEIILIESNKPVAPFLLPSPNEMIAEAKYHGKCLNPIISQRCNFSMNGLSCIPFKNGKADAAYIFRSTSIGDIFYQKVVVKSNSENTTDLDSFERNAIKKDILSVWEQNCKSSVENLKNEPLKVTSVVNKNKIKTVLNKKVDGRVEKELNKKNHIPSGTWRVSKKKIMEDDPLSQCLLALWNIDEDEWMDNKRKTKDFDHNGEENGANDKISSWFSQIPNELTNVNNEASTSIILNSKVTMNDSDFFNNINDVSNIPHLSHKRAYDDFDHLNFENSLYNTSSNICKKNKLSDKSRSSIGF